MKKMWALAFVAFATFMMTACTSSDLIIYMPKEYIADGIVQAFEEEYGIKVDLRTFDSNEIALTQARISRYDLIIPSDYAIEEFADAGLIQELDWDKIEFDPADFSEALVDTLAELEEAGFDLLKYAMPYFWGTIGLIYDNTKEGLAEQLEEEGWGILADQSLTKMIYDSPRDAFMAALYAQDPVVYMSDATQSDVEAARDWLISTKGTNTVLLSDEILDQAIGGNVPYDIAMVYSGDAVYILQETDDYSFFIPEYSNVWVDGMVIPKNAVNVDMAYNFINFISSYEVSLENTWGMGYSPVRQDVLDELMADEEFNWDDERIGYAFALDTTLFSYEFYRFNNELKKWIDDSYDEFYYA
ncbi:extracellular solute-binding protein [Acholeplasma equirhinis]|uniref:extracellular solute-binding protein n=1 Tax=Acholeplasma equirhinis TaxID=555393 RepID=UPI00197AA465|nr:extracellular solute-binding protein [Acholeplasma equirhinis]MBN3490206.1 extracellular solute-binding protein [Acholeplasma equirhinis]